MQNSFRTTTIWHGGHNPRFSQKHGNCGEFKLSADRVGDIDPAAADDGSGGVGQKLSRNNSSGATPNDDDDDDDDDDGADGGGNQKEGEPRRRRPLVLRVEVWDEDRASPADLTGFHNLDLEPQLLQQLGARTDNPTFCR